MSEVHHFSFGLVTPAVAYVMSCIGSFLGLLCTARGRGASSAGARAGWLALGAVSIGGTGIWVMHFIAMLGFHVPGMDIRYDVPLTLASAVIAMVVVGIGLFVLGFGGMRPPALAAGGVFTGLGVAAMHYLGMRAIRLPGHMSYDTELVTLSVVIAVVAATAALWFTAKVTGPWPTMGAAMVMGVAVSGMHYTGMAAVGVHADAAAGEPGGAQAFDFLMPLVIGISVLALVLLMIIGLWSPEDEPRGRAPAPAPRQGQGRRNWFGD